MSFGSNLERIRKQHHISQTQLGTALGLTQQMISNYEKELSSPNMESLKKIAQYFEISVDQLIGHTPPKENKTSVDRRFLKYFQELTETDKEKCLTIIRTILEDREINLPDKDYISKK